MKGCMVSVTIEKIISVGSVSDLRLLIPNRCLQ